MVQFFFKKENSIQHIKLKDIKKKCLIYIMYSNMYSMNILEVYNDIVSFNIKVVFIRKNAVIFNVQNILLIHY